MKNADKTQSLAKYIKSLSDFKYVKPDTPYNHMGATIVDAMLQAGVTYETVVKPRVDVILRDYPEAKTTTGFFEVIKTKKIKRILKWQDDEKPNRIIEATQFFIREKVETEDQLKSWLEKEMNMAKLDSVRGVGAKTIDYYKFLVGIPTTAIDRHMRNFLSSAGICTETYDEAKNIINDTADSIGVNRTLLDHSIWKYMSKKRKRSSCHA